MKILCLHGYRGSGQVLRRQMKPLLDSATAIIDWVFIDAPALAAGDYGWWHARAPSPSNAGQDAGVASRARHYDGWERTRAVIIAAVDEHGPFDGIFGFSQGAALTGLLVGLRPPRWQGPR